MTVHQRATDRRNAKPQDKQKELVEATRQEGWCGDGWDIPVSQASGSQSVLCFVKYGKKF